MPTVTVARPDVTRDEAMQAVRQEFGSEYNVKPGGKEGVFSVSRGALTGATVHVRPGEGATEFHVHGTGLIIGRIINELTIARRVAAAIAKAPVA